MWAYPLAGILAIVTWFAPVRLPTGVKAMLGMVMVALASFYLATLSADSHSLTSSGGGLAPILVAGPMLAGGAIYLVGISIRQRGRIASSVQLLGLLLVGIVLALPSGLVLGLPIVAVMIVSTIRDILKSPEAPGALRPH